MRRALTDAQLDELPPKGSALAAMMVCVHDACAANAMCRTTVKGCGACPPGACVRTQNWPTPVSGPTEPMGPYAEMGPYWPRQLSEPGEGQNRVDECGGSEQEGVHTLAPRNAAQLGRPGHPNDSGGWTWRSLLPSPVTEAALTNGRADTPCAKKSTAH